MTIVTLNPAVDGDDAGIEASGAWYNLTVLPGISLGNVGVLLHVGLRFPSTGIPQGATINDASLQLATITTTVGTTFGAAYGDDVDSPVAFSGTNRVTTRTKTTASTLITDANKADIDVTAIVQELVNRASFGGTIALLLDATGVSSGSQIQTSSSTLTDYDLVVDYTAAVGGRTGSLAATETGPDTSGITGTVSQPSVTAAFAVQHLTPTDIGTSGGTLSPTAVSSLSSAIALNINSRYIGGGPDGSAATINVDDASMGVRFTATNTVTIDRESAAAINNRASVAVWEYIGAGGGANEFIVRDRRTITLSSANSSSFTPSGISDATAVIPIITGIRHSNTGTTHGYLTAACTIDRSTGEVTAYGRGGSNTAVIEITTVEFTGANWTVHYGTATGTGDTGTISLDASVTDWADSWIIHQFWKGSAPTNHAIADVTPTYVPGASANQVDWAFHTDHDGETDQLHVAYVLENASMEVTRFTSTDSSAGNVNIDITSAGLTDVAEALVWVSSSSSGTGTAHLRGTRNAQITSTTQAQHYAHRSGNTVDVRLQVIKLPQDAASSGSTGTLDAAEAGPDTSAAAGATSVAGALNATETGPDAAAASGATAVSAAMAASEAAGDGAAMTGGASIAGALAAMEAGEDALVATGAAQIGAALAATDGGSDAAAVTGASPCTGGLAAQGAGSDSATASGAVAVSGALDATESGVDDFTATGGTDTAITGALATQEGGNDAAAMAGVLLVSGDLTAQEAGGDIPAANGAVSIEGALVAQEVGGDTFDGSAAAGRAGALAALEIGGDIASVAAAVGVLGTVAAVEAGEDAVILVGAAAITGALGASEIGGDIAAILGFSTGDDTTSITIAGAWQSHEAAGTWAAHSAAGTWAAHSASGTWAAHSVAATWAAHEIKGVWQ